MKKKTKTMCKVLSVFLAFLIVVQILPLQVLAENITDAIAHKEFIEDVVNNPTSVEDTSKAEILYEVEEKRDEHTKVYKKSDGTYTAVKTVEPIHYLDDGVWEEINNSMTLNGNLYTNTDNLFNVEFPESIDSNENLTVEKDGYELSFSIDEIEESSAVVENDIVASDTNIAVADEAISQTQSSVTYSNVAENTDLQYIVTSNSIKENIIVSSKESVKDTYTFTFETNGLDAQKLDDGSVVFKDENDEIKFRIPRPVMTDASLAFSYDINVVLIENTDGTITLEYSPSSDWTNNSDRVYPITIDPAITVGKYEPWVDDTYVACKTDIANNDTTMKTENFHDADVAKLANEFIEIDSSGKTTKYSSEIYTRINMEYFKNLGNNIVFTEVQYIFAGLIKTEGKFLAKEISEYWEVDNVTYDDKIKLSDEIIDYYTSPLFKGEQLENPIYIHFNITKIFNDWFNGKKNNGFAVVANENAVADFALNGGYQCTAITIDYVDMGGYNKNLNYHTQTVGRAGTGYVNDFTQRLSVIRDDIYVDDEIMPVTIGMIYDSATYDKLESLNYNSLLAYGNNWIPNYLRAYLIINENNFTYYTDTGSTIDFMRSTDNEGNVIFTELFSETYGNQGYELEYFPASNGNNEYYIINKPDGCFEKFNEYGLLTSVTKIVCDEQSTVNTNEQTTSNYVEKSISVTYDSNFRIDYITDSVGRKYDYVYDSVTKLLSTIKVFSADGTPITVGTTDSPLEVSYTYDIYGNLTGVTHPNGATVEYMYDENGKIISMTLVNSCCVTYTYDDNGHVTTILEKTYNGTEYVPGDEITYDRLSTTQIKITSESDGCKIYQFNVKGNLLHIIDDSQLMPTSISNESNLIENNLEYWTTQENSENVKSSINNDIYTLEIPGGTDIENIVYQTVSIDGRKNDTIEISGWLKGNFTKSSTNNAKLLDLIKNSEDPKLCNFTNDRYAQIEVVYTYNGINENGNQETLTETIVVPFSENIADWQFSSKNFVLKGDCNEIIVVVRYSKNANHALLSNIELLQNGGYIIDCNKNEELTNISLDQQDIISYTYDNGKISSIVYYNEANEKTTMEFEYNSAGNVTKIAKNGKTKYLLKYEYNNDNKLVKILSSDDRIIRYVDDVTGISSFTNNHFFSIRNEGGIYEESLNDVIYTTTVNDVEYDISNGLSIEISSLEIEDSGDIIAVGSAQDWYGRRSASIIQIDNQNTTGSQPNVVSVRNEYDYSDDAVYSTLNNVETYKNIISTQKPNTTITVNSYHYKYDESGNVIEEYDYDSEHSTQLRRDYEYDEDNRLITCNDYVLKCTYEFEYDADGNSTYTYTAHDTENIDQSLIEYNNQNSDVYRNGATLTWNGQQLDTYVRDDKIINYEYDENGFCNKKTITIGDTTKTYHYTWAYGKLINQFCTKGDESTLYTVKYIYDSFNSVQGFVLNHSKTYFYLKNIYGDIVSIVDESGKIILSYEYDIFGVPTTTYKDTTHINIDSIDMLPLKYRGCCYDYNTGLYYIENRYYNPGIGRFINANGTENDGLSKTNTIDNLFTYWENYPTKYISSDEYEIYRINSIANYLYNKELSNELANDLKKTDGFIINQTQGIVSRMRYGFSTTGPTGCGWVATYNALKMLDDPMKPEDVIHKYEMNGGLSVYGFTGTHPFNIVQFFNKKGYSIDIILDNFDQIEEKRCVNIMDFSHSYGGHYVALKWDNSKYWGYNTFNKNYGANDWGSSISKFLQSNDYTGRILISIF